MPWGHCAPHLVDAHLQLALQRRPADPWSSSHPSPAGPTEATPHHWPLLTSDATTMALPNHPSTPIMSTPSFGQWDATPFRFTLSRPQPEPNVKEENKRLNICDDVIDSMRASLDEQNYCCWAFAVFPMTRNSHVITVFRRLPGVGGLMAQYREQRSSLR